MNNILSNDPIIIIGAGPAGYKVALELRKQFSAQKIILIEKNKLGGTCLHAGCIPSKQLASISDLNDYPRVLKKNLLILEKAIASELKQAEIEVVFAEAVIREDGSVSCNGIELEYSHLVIAIGSKPKSLIGFEGALNSDSFFAESNLAKGFADKYCFIGGGYIGVELASMLAKHGKQVRILEAQSEIMGFLDPLLQEKIIQELKKEGVRIETSVREIKTHSDETVVVSIGREKNITNLPIAENIHIIGDASQGAALAHYAYAQARALAYKLAAKSFEIKHIPYVIFTNPELAGIGLNSTQAEQQYGKDNIETIVINWASNAKARIVGAERGLTKWVILKETSCILGCHLFGEGATDLISIAVPMINQNLTIKDIEQMVFPHPTLGELFAF